MTGLTAPNPLGINLAAVAYYSTEQPFLNIVKSGGSSSSNGTVNGWYTSNATALDTQEEAYLQLIRMAIRPHSLPRPHFRGGQQFTYATTMINYNLPASRPGRLPSYPAGTYRLKFAGQGTVQVAGDASFVSGNTCSSSLALTNSSANTYASCTFTISDPAPVGEFCSESTADHQQAPITLATSALCKCLRIELRRGRHLQSHLPIRVERVLQPALHGVDEDQQ